MPPIDNQQVKSTRDQLLDRMSSRYPDRDFSGANGENGVNGQELLEQSILESLDEYANNQTEYTAKNDALNKLFYSDPKSAEFIQKWLDSGDPRAALVETFGDELQDLATEEGRGQFSANLQSWRDRKAESDNLNAEAETNWNNSLEALESWGNEKGLSNDEKVQIMMRLVSVAANGLQNKYEVADFDMALKELRYDQAVSDARREGEVAGRNAKIDENKKRRQASGAMPPSLSGQGARVAEQKPAVASSPWAGIE